MAVEMIGQAGMTYELKQTYDRILLSVADQDVVYLKYGVKKPIPARGGKSIEFRRFEKIDASSLTALTEGTMPSETNATISIVSCTISQYGQYAKISDLLEVQGFDPVIEEYVRKFGIAMGEGLDTVVRNALSSATTLQYAGSKTSVGTSVNTSVGSGDLLNAAELREMKRTLRRAGARQISGRYICFIHPDNTKDLYEDPDIVDAFLHAAPKDNGNPLFTGVIGDWEGIRFVETNNLRVRSSYGCSGADVYEVVMFGDEYYGVSELSAMSAKTIIHPRGTGGHTDPLEQFSTVGWKAALAAKILNDNFGGIIYVSSSRSAA